MAKDVVFAEEELDVIIKMALRADPFNLIAEVVSIRNKIQMYMQERYQEQIAEQQLKAAQEADVVVEDPLV